MWMTHASQISKRQEMQSLLIMIILFLGYDFVTGCSVPGQVCTYPEEENTLGEYGLLIWFRTLPNVCDACRSYVWMVGGDHRVTHHAISIYPFCNSPHEMLTPSVLKPFFYQGTIITGGSRSQTAQESPVRTVDTSCRHRRKNAKNWRIILVLTKYLWQMAWIWEIVATNNFFAANTGLFLGLMP